MNDLMGRPDNTDIGELSSVASFKQALQGLGREQVEVRVKEVSSLLSVSKGNLEAVQNQGWFSRAWSTVTGKNGRVARVNQGNLLRAQMKVVEMLQSMMDSDRIVVDAIFSALQDVEKARIENERLKMAVIRLFEIYDDRFSVIEGRQEEFSRQIQSMTAHYAGKEKQLAVIVKRLSFVMLGIAAVSVALALNAGGLALALSVVLGLLSLTLSGTFFWTGRILDSRNPAGLSEHSTTEQIPELAEPGQVDGESLALPEAQSDQDPEPDAEKKRVRNLVALNKSMRIKVIETYEAEMTAALGILIGEEMEGPYVRMLEARETAHQEFRNATDAFDRVIAVDRLIKVTPSLPGKYQRHVTATLGLMRSFSINVLKDIAAELNVNPDQIRIDRTLAKRSVLKQWCDEVEGCMREYDDMSGAIDEVRKKLRKDFPRWQKLSHESDSYRMTMKVVKAALVVPYFVDDEEDFIKDFSNNLRLLTRRWNQYANELTGSFNDHMSLAAKRFALDVSGTLIEILDAADFKKVSFYDLAERIPDIISARLEAG